MRLWTDGSTEMKWDEILRGKGGGKNPTFSLSVFSYILMSMAASGSVLPFADPVRSSLQHSSDGVGDGCPA